jgi:precorrin-2/cobalt-factor-2 C20-methyltransferase
MAVKRGALPMSNQCRVPAGTRKIRWFRRAPAAPPRQCAGRTSPALHKKTHLVLVVDMLAEKLLAQGLAIRMIGAEADGRVHRGGSGLWFAPGRSPERKPQESPPPWPLSPRPPSRPALKGNPALAEGLADSGGIVAGEQGLRRSGTAGVENLQMTHRRHRRRHSSLKTSGGAPGDQPSERGASRQTSSSRPPAGSPRWGWDQAIPDLLTVAALRAIAAATVVAYPVAQVGGEGMAAHRGALAGPLPAAPAPALPMVDAAEPQQEAWHCAAAILASEAQRGGAARAALRGRRLPVRQLLLCAPGTGGAPPRLPPARGAGDQRRGRRRSSGRLQPGPALAPGPAAGGGPADPPTPETPAELAKLLERAAASATVLALLKLGRRWSWVRPCLEERRPSGVGLVCQPGGLADQQLLAAAAVPADAALPAAAASELARRAALSAGLHPGGGLGLPQEAITSSGLARATAPGASRGRKAAARPTQMLAATRRPSFAFPLAGPGGARPPDPVAPPAAASPGRGEPAEVAAISPTTQGAPRLPRPTITPLAQVTARQPSASAGLRTSPSATTGRRTARFTAAMALPVGRGP